MGTGTILIVAVVSAALGYAAGLILTRMNANKKNDQSDDANGAGEPGQRFEANRLTVSLWSKTQNGPLHADLYGRTLHTRDQITTAEKARLQNDLRSIQAWFGLNSSPQPTQVLEPTVPSAAARPAAVVPTAAPTQAPPEPVVPHIPEPELPKPVIVNQAPAAVEVPPVPANIPSAQDLPKIQVTPDILEEAPSEVVVPVPARLNLGSKPKPVVPTKSLVEQVNDILQDKVAASKFASTGIKLVSSPQGGVIVWIGNQSYPGVDVTPEGEEKQLIRESIHEWEKR